VEYPDVEAYAAAWKRRLAQEEARGRELAARAEKVARNAAATLVQRYGATEVWLFGSLARGRFRPGSDIDLAARGLPAREYFRILSEINADQEFDLDLIDLDACPPWLAEAVRQQGRLLARRDPPEGEPRREGP